MKKPLTLGFLVNDVLSGYQARLVQGLENAAARRDARLLVFSGGYLSPTHDGVELQCAFLHGTARKPAVDGLIVEGSILSTEVGAEAVAQLCFSLGVPFVSIGALPETTCVTLDQASGVERLVDHLVTVHGRRRLAFIGGPRGNSSSEERELAFRRALHARGVNIDERLVLPGSFLEFSGLQAIESLATQGILHELDGVVAANDLMALGAIAALQARSIDVPGAVAVVGFDDEEIAATSRPRLTTVRQSASALGEHAVDVLLDGLRGSSRTPSSVGAGASNTHRVPVEVVLRESCGCNPEPVRPAPPPDRGAEQHLHPGYLLHRFVQLSHVLSVLGSAMGTAEEVESLQRLLRTTLPHLGLDTCAVFLFADEQAGSTPAPDSNTRPTRLIVSHHEPTSKDSMVRAVPDIWRLIYGPEKSTNAPTSSTVRLPGASDWTTHLPPQAQHQHLLVHPLSFAHEVLGFAAFSMPARLSDAWLMEGIAGHLSSAIANLRAREKLREATVRAEAASTAKSEFLAMMSHELRTPLTGVLGHLDLAVREAREPSLRQRLELAHSSARVLLRSVNDVLDFSKLEAERVELESVAFHVEEVLQQLLDTCGMAVAKKGLELVFDVDPEVPSILVGDPLRLSQVLVNLLSNATKFSRQGRITVGLDVLEQHPDDSVTLCFSVTDTGIGMSSGQLSGLFQPFVQGDNSTTRRYGGTGLGLAICQRLARLLGCDIRASSVVGQGSRFSFCPTLLAPSELSDGQRGRPSPQLILLVEPDEEQARAIARTLTRDGHRVYWAPDDRTAGQIVAETNESFDLCLASHPNDDHAADFVQRCFSAQNPPPKLVRLVPFGDDVGSPTAANAVTVLPKPPLPSRLLAACQREALATSSPLALAGRQLLLVQDNPMSRDVLCAMLASAGARVLAIESGSAAIGAVRQGNFDAILMDVNLPDIDGYEATRLIRSAGFQLPIVAVTADHGPLVRRTCLSAGMNDCLVTPLPAHELCSSIARWLGVAAPSAQVARSNDGMSQGNTPALFDAAGGLRHVGGNRAVYQGLLRRFLNHETWPGRTKCEALPADEALTLVHGLVSASGNVGAWALSAKAQAIETALRQKSPLDASVWAELERIWQETNDAIAQHLDAGTPETEDPVDSSVGAAQVELLARALREHDTSALDVLPAVLRWLRRHNPSHVVLRFEGAVRAYDFEGSIVLLEAMQRSA